MLGEDSSTERIDLAERDGSHSGSFKSETEAADAAEEIEDIHSRPISARDSAIPERRRVMARLV